MPNVFENRCPGCDANAGADEHGDFVVEYIFGGCTIWSIHTDRGHGLSVLEGNFVHAVGVETFKIFGLGRTATECISKCSGEISDLADVDAEIWIEGAGGNGEWMPLGTGYVRYLEKYPLSGFVLHAWFVKLDLHGS
jgi:hypothetical protein